MVNPLDKVKSNHTAAERQADRERSADAEKAIRELRDALERYIEHVTEHDYEGLDIIAFDSDLTQEFAGKVFGAGGNFASPANIAMIFTEDGEHQLLNDGGAGGVLDVPARSQSSYPVRVLPVDRGEQEIFRSHLPSGQRRSKWQAYDESVFIANNEPRDIKGAAGHIESEINTLRVLAARKNMATG